MFGSCFRRLSVILVSDRLICYSFIETFDQDKALAMRVHVGRGGGIGVRAVRGGGGGGCRLGYACGCGVREGGWR